jgi:hypothetical protein
MREAALENPNPRLQTPSKLQESKIQDPKKRIGVELLPIGDWSLGIVWALELGIWDFAPLGAKAAGFIVAPR